MTRASYGWPAAIVGIAAAATLAAFLDANAAIRAPIVIVFVLTAPGLALVRLVPVRDCMVVASLAIAVSIALATLVPLVLLYAGLWSPHAALAVLAGVAMVAAIVDARRMLDGGRKRSL